jgi:hypothetical protein
MYVVVTMWWRKIELHTNDYRDLPNHGDFQVIDCNKTIVKPVQVDSVADPGQGPRAEVYTPGESFFQLQIFQPSPFYIHH